MVIAVDGPAGAGKSTVARALARRLGYTYLDSGAMYRCLALATLRAGADPDDADAVEEIAATAQIEVGEGSPRLAGEEVAAEIRSAEVSALASRVSVHPGVRARLVEQQRRLVSRGSWVAEGRDIGTVVCPDSPLKVHLTASAEERARRRAAESGAPFEQVLASQLERDERDRRRSHGALVRADDAVDVDTTGLGIDEVVERIAALAAERGLP